MRDNDERGCQFVKELEVEQPELGVADSHLAGRIRTKVDSTIDDPTGGCSAPAVHMAQRKVGEVEMIALDENLLEHRSSTGLSSVSSWRSLLQWKPEMPRSSLQRTMMTMSADVDAPNLD